MSGWGGRLGGVCFFHTLLKGETFLPFRIIALQPVEPFPGEMMGLFGRFYFNRHYILYVVDLKHLAVE
jgi:hypothetical protein